MRERWIWFCGHADQIGFTGSCKARGKKPLSSEAKAREQMLEHMREQNHTIKRCFGGNVENKGFTRKLDKYERFK